MNNSINITYAIKPSDPLLVLNNGSTNFISLVSFPEEPGITINTALLDPDTGNLVIELDYIEHLQDKEIKLQITPPDVPQAFLVSNQTVLWTVKTTNQLAVVAYSEEDYKEL